MQDTADYQRGFNDGFKLAKFQPQLWEKLKSSLNKSNEYECGLIEGAQQLEAEKEKGRLNELNGIRTGKTKNKEQNKDR